MDADFVLALLHESLMTTVYLAGPLLLVSMAVGLVVSVVQAATQIQEMTLVFVPKMLSVFVVMIFAGAFMLDLIASFTLMIFDLIASIGGV